MAGDWLSEMVGQILRSGVGVVGAKLNYPNRSSTSTPASPVTLAWPGHVRRGVDRFDLGYFGDLALTRSISAVTGACMLVRREVWDDLGGLDTSDLAVAFNDIDFCLRAQEAGWTVIWTPFAQLVHHESILRGDATTWGLGAGATPPRGRLHAATLGPPPTRRSGIRPEPDLDGRARHTGVAAPGQSDPR